MEVKVCGMRDADNVRQVARLGIDIMGFIFYPKSPRCVCKPIPRTEYDINVTRVGVFVNEKLDVILNKVMEYGLDAVQLHGNESRALCLELSKYMVSSHFEYGKLVGDRLMIYKAISVATADDIQKYKEYAGAVDLFLFDTKCKTVGGSGQQFDWSVLEQYDGDVPFLLSGGIGPEDAERIKNFHHPKCVGIDLNSKFEIEPGLKDVSKLKEFLEKIK